jgi:hypothetical protein
MHQLLMDLEVLDSACQEADVNLVGPIHSLPTMTPLQNGIFFPDR